METENHNEIITTNEQEEEHSEHLNHIDDENEGIIHEIDMNEEPIEEKEEERKIFGYESYEEMNEDQIIIRLDLEDEQAIIEWEEQEEILSLKRMKITTESEKSSKRTLPKSQQGTKQEKEVNKREHTQTTVIEQEKPTTNQSLRFPIQMTKQEIPQEGMKRDELTKCRTIIKKMMAKPEAIAFNQPVDPIALCVPTYFDVIKNPMDFGTISKNLNAKRYFSKDDFYSDMILVFDNATLFNHVSSDVYKWAVKLRKEFETLYAGTFTEKKVVEKRFSETPHNDSMKTIEEKRTRATSSSTRNTRRTTIVTKKEYSPEEIASLRDQLKSIGKNKEKLKEILKIVNVDGTGKSEVSINLNKCTYDQLYAIERVIKGPRGRKPRNEHENLTSEQLQKELDKLNAIKKEANKNVAPQPKKDDDSESDLSSSSLDSEEENLLRMSRQN